MTDESCQEYGSVFTHIDLYSWEAFCRLFPV